MKKLLFIGILFVVVKGFSQDSIVNYLDSKGKLTSSTNARYFEIIKKKSDTIWMISMYRKSGKLIYYSFSKSKDKKEKIGQFVSFFETGQKSGMHFYDVNGLRKGKVESWFRSGQTSLKGRFLNDKKVGVWNYYHFNGKLASRLFYKNDSLIKSVAYDENGVKSNKKVITSEKAKFKGGERKFKSIVRKLSKQINFKVKGQIIVNFVIDINGVISTVFFDEKIPDFMKTKIELYFKNIKGWKPGKNMNRRVATVSRIPLTFK